jgi:hypothetical protein
VAGSGLGRFIACSRVRCRFAAEAAKRLSAYKYRLQNGDRERQTGPAPAAMRASEWHRRRSAAVVVDQPAGSTRGSTHVCPVEQTRLQDHPVLRPLLVITGLVPVIHAGFSALTQCVDGRNKSTAVRFCKYGCSQQDGHNPRSPRPGVTRPSTSFYRSAVLAGKAWMPGTSPGKGLPKLLCGRQCSPPRCNDDRTGQPWVTPGYDDLWSKFAHHSFCLHGDPSARSDYGKRETSSAFSVMNSRSAGTPSRVLSMPRRIAALISPGSVTRSP